MADRRKENPKLVMASPTFGHFSSSGTTSSCARSPLRGASDGNPGVLGGGDIVSNS